MPGPQRHLGNAGHLLKGVPLRIPKFVRQLTNTAKSTKEILTYVRFRRFSPHYIRRSPGSLNGLSGPFMDFYLVNSVKTHSLRSFAGREKSSLRSVTPKMSNFIGNLLRKLHFNSR